MTDYKSMFEQAVRTLAAIDEALGIGDDGCGDPDQTLTAIADLKASPISEEAMDILRAENEQLERERDQLATQSEAMREAIELYEQAFEGLFTHCLSNGIFNAWQKPLDCTLINNAHNSGQTLLNLPNLAAEVLKRRDAKVS